MQSSVHDPPTFIRRFRSIPKVNSAGNQWAGRFRPSFDNAVSLTVYLTWYPFAPAHQADEASIQRYA